MNCQCWRGPDSGDTVATSEHPQCRTARAANRWLIGRRTWDGWVRMRHDAVPSGVVLDQRCTGEGRGMPENVTSGANDWASFGPMPRTR